MQGLDPRQGTAWGWWLLMFAVGLAGTFLARRYALRRKLLDQPGDRRSHAMPTPRGGGISIVVAMLMACAAWAWLEPAHRMTSALAAIGLALVAGIGWIDDHRPLSPWLRLAVHGAASGLLGFGLFGLAGDAGLALAGGITALVLINVWNFMDGIDGLAVSQAMLCAAGFAMVGNASGIGAWLSLTLVAGCAGFLPFNLPRARIFLGDVGSGALGYLLALCAGLVATAPGMTELPSRPALLLLLPLAAFAIDASLTLTTRMVRGEKWWQPHVQHLYQRLARRWGSHRRVTGVFATYTLLSCCVATLVRSFDAAVIMSAVFAWYGLGAGIWWFTRKEIRE